MDSKSAGGPTRSVQDQRSTGSGGDHENSSSNEKTNSSNNAGEDDWRVRAWEVFTAVADRGCVTIDGMTTFANEMNVECDLRHVTRAIRQEGFEGNIGFDQATRLLEVIPVMMYDESSETEQNEDRHVLKLLPWEYLYHRLKPEEERKKIEDEKTVKLVYCGCTPQQFMLIATGMIFLAVVGAILGLMIGLWITSDQRMYHETLDVSARIASQYIDIATDISRDGLMQAMEDFVLFTSNAIESDTRSQIEVLKASGYNRVVLDYPMVQALVNATITGCEAEMKGRLAAIGDLANTTILDPVLLSTIVATISNWVLTSGYEYFVMDPTMTTVYGSTATMDLASKASCFAPLQLGQSGFFENGKGVRGAINARVAYVATPSVRVCVSLSQGHLQTIVRKAVVDLIDHANNATMSSNDTPRMPLMETVIAFKDASYKAGQMSVRTIPRYSTMFCDLDGDSGPESSEACASFQNLLEQCRATKCQWQNYTTYYYNGEVAIVSMTYEEGSDVVIASGQSYDWAIQIARSTYIEVAGAINSYRLLPLELSISTITKNHDLIPQINAPMYACPTGAECRWLPSAIAPIRNAFRVSDPSIAVCPNYVFDPVISGSKMLFFNDTLTVHSKIESSQLKLATAIGDALDAANKIIPKALEIQLYKHTDSKFLKTFDATAESCPTDASCETDRTLGIVEMSNCVGCRRVYPANASTSTEFVTTLLCSGPECDSANPKVDMSLFSLVNYDSDEFTTGTGQNYHGNSASATVHYISSVDAVIGVFADNGVLNEYRNKVFTIFSVIIVFCVIVSVVALVIFTRQTLKKVENEWLVYKASIEGEKQKFNTMFQEIVPPKVLVKYHRGQKIIAELHPMLSIAFVDVCAFAERQKAMSAKEVVRTIAYHFEVYATVAAKFKLFRLKTFGDSTAVVGGIGTKEPASAIAFSVASFAGYVAQILSPLFSHYPQLHPKLAEAYKNDPNPERPRQVFQIRIGLHAGAATSSMVDYGRTPSFDLLGPSLSLARRMQVTAAPGRINCSTAFKEQLEMGDFAGQFEFDAIKKLVAKGQGTVSTYPIRSMSMTIDEMLLQRLHIQYAHGMFDFRPLAAQCKGTGKSQGSSSAPSNKTGDSASIHDSMMASTNPPGPDDRHY